MAPLAIHKAVKRGNPYLEILVRLALPVHALPVAVGLVRGAVGVHQELAGR